MPLKPLSPNWFAEGDPDPELKHYQLLAWLQQVRDEFRLAQLYPAFSELMFHHRNLLEFRNALAQMKAQFPRKLEGQDAETGLLRFIPAVHDDQVLEQVNEVVETSVPLIGSEIEAGKQIFDFIEEKIKIDPVGVEPLYRNAGYFLLRAGDSQEVKAFQYQLSEFWENGENYRQITTSHIYTFRHSLSNPFPRMKQDLLRRHKKLPNPATYAVVCELGFPEQASLLPVAKRKIFRHLIRKSA